jgi:ribose-phosphate pyrophosphokinase
VKVAKSYAGKLDCSVAMIYKHRTEPGKVGEMCLIGEVKGKHCVIADDMVDSGGTLIKASNLLLSSGAVSVECYCTHAVLSGKAIDNIRRSNIKRLYVTDTIDKKYIKSLDQIEILSSAELFAEAIQGINQERSLSYLFDD